MLRYLSTLLARRRAAIGCRRGKLSASRQALLTHLRNGDTYSRLAAGFRVAVATVSCYLREAADLLAATAPTLRTAIPAARAKAFVVLDDTLIRISRVGVRAKTDRLYYSGKRKRHDVNVQLLADPAGSSGPYPPGPAQPTT